MQNNIKLAQYSMQVRERLGENAMAVLLMKTVIWLNPWLREYEMGFDGPVAVITEDKESIAQIVGELRGFETSSVKAITSPPKEIRVHFRSCTYATAFFELQEGRYTENNLLYIRDECGEIDMDISQRRLAVVFAVGGVPDKYAEYFSGFVYVSKTGRRKGESNRESGNHFLRFVIDYVVGRPDALMRMLEDDLIENFDIAGHILKALISENLLMYKSADRYLAEVDAAIEKLKGEWECPSNSDAVCDLFCRTLYNIPRTLKIRMYNRKKIPGMSEKEMMNSVYYDDNYYYMPNTVYTEICRIMDSPYGEKHITAQLISAGVLVRTGVSRVYHTVHTELVSVYGIVARVRMVKLVKSAIDRKDDFSLQEILEEMTDKKSEECGIALGQLTSARHMVRLARDIMNNSILISGKSGSGKTHTLKILSYRIVAQGGTVLILNYNDAFTDMEDCEHIYRIEVMSQGLPVSLLSSVCRADNSEEDEKDLIDEATEILCNVVHLHAKQKHRLREALKQAIRDEREMDDIRKLEDALQGKDEASDMVYEYCRRLFNNVKCNHELNLFEEGKVTILDFSGYPSQTQQFLSELVLSVLWRQFRNTGIARETMLYVVCDEFQVLSIKQNSVLNQMLREGRKFHLALLLATQTLEPFDGQERAIVQQAATQLYFRPAEREMRNIARCIDISNPDRWVSEVQSLKIGECVALGRFQINGRIYERPLKISFKENKRMEGETE